MGYVIYISFGNRFCNLYICEMIDLQNLFYDYDYKSIRMNKFIVFACLVLCIISFEINKAKVIGKVG